MVFSNKKPSTPARPYNTALEARKIIYFTVFFLTIADINLKLKKDENLRLVKKAMVAADAKRSVIKNKITDNTVKIKNAAFFPANAPVRPPSIMKEISNKMVYNTPYKKEPPNTLNPEKNKFFQFDHSGSIASFLYILKFVLTAK